MQDPRFYSLVLHRLPHVGAASFQRLIKHFGSPEAALSAPINRLQSLLDEESLSAVREFQSHADNSAVGQKALLDLEWLDLQPDVHLVSISDASYPELLSQIPKVPPLLFVRGDIHLLSLPQIAIVGSRNPSAGGGENAQRFAEFLAANGFVITSGLALGVDAAAHQGALAGGGKTIAVMGTGLDLIYPSRHRRLAQEIVETGGALVSELPLGSGSKAANFPQRNRIISGLSWGVLVVEAAVQSGSLITAQAALQQNREVFAIPGSIHNPLARGCHQLIRQGATLVETGQDIVDQLQGMLGYQLENLHKLKQKAAKKTELDEKSLDLLSPAEQQIIRAMGYDPVNIDDLVERTGIAVGSIAGQLIGLEIKGFVQQIGAGYQRV
ncbi:DNA protecting protein DprA [Cellvibrio zantedeschiae]|uniref:DNA protecting protein DprA n=1 Tax=Cellvibrio zantedeschiae TaxID=1237077 RepID=A0ABQ3BDL8_9GAMM|nr:DNA-processing protein DprA [Cellvibrio zantedeschiae]GGY88480.1 DNA protecting protein DprA [Cellvibrio zantedeschiae]